MSTLPTHRWEQLRSAELAALDASRLIAVLPLGATEQHGPHLPLGTDADMADAMVRAAITSLAPDVPALFLPVQRIGFSVEHLGCPGTLSLSPATCLSVWGDIAESLAASGVKKLVLFNTHGGHEGLMDAAARTWRQRLGMLVYTTSWYKLPLVDEDGQDLMARMGAEERRFGVHAGQSETAMMLAIAPQSVDMQSAQHFASTSQQRAAAFPILGNGSSAKLAWMARDLNPAGAAGNAAAATADYGRALIAATGRALAALLAEIDRLSPDTALPQ